MPSRETSRSLRFRVHSLWLACLSRCRYQRSCTSVAAAVIAVVVVAIAIAIAIAIAAASVESGENRADKGGTRELKPLHCSLNDSGSYLTSAHHKNRGPN